MKFNPHRHAEPPNYIVSLLPTLTVEQTPIYQTFTVSFGITHRKRLSVSVVDGNDHEIAHRDARLPARRFIQWHTLYGALEFAAEVQETHGICNLVLQSDLPALRIIAEYCRRVKWIKDKAISRGHNERGYSYRHAEQVLGNRMDDVAFSLVWFAIWRLIVGKFNDRIEFVIQG